MNRKEELEYVKAGLKSYDRLERKNVDEVGWIMLKLSCGRAKAAKLVAAARQDSQGAA